MSTEFVDPSPGNRSDLEWRLHQIHEFWRLLYVGVTRAMDRLTLSLSLSRFKWGKARATIPSRFLFELQGRADSPQARKALGEARQSARGSLPRKQPVGPSPRPGKPVSRPR